MRLALLALLTAISCAGADDPSAAASFTAILPVLRHPRCMACHSVGNYPRQGNDLHPHIMQVRRGSQGDGAPPVLCSTCHQETNSPGLHAPPGAPDWHLPPPATPMIWEGKSPKELCELIKDPARNGHKTIRQIVEHMQTPLVLWGWNPGEGRDPVLMPLPDFLQNVKQWAANGAACPAN